MNKTLILLYSVNNINRSTVMPPCEKVLLVDDDEDIRITVEEILNSAGITVIVTGSGKECLSILEKGFCGIILMDIMMPGMDGWETIEEIIKRNYAKGTIIAMLTAKEIPDPEKEYLKNYVIDYITKPFDPDELVEVVRYYISILKAGNI